MKKLTDCKICLAAVQADANWDASGYWETYYPHIKVSILLGSLANPSELILKKISTGDFIIDTEDFKGSVPSFRSEIDESLTKKNIVYVASKSKDLNEFVKKLQKDLYDTTLDWYKENFTTFLDEDDFDDEIEFDNSDGVNRFALHDITYYKGNQCFYVGEIRYAAI